MSQHLLMGAINTETNQYEYPLIADKQKKYKCPSCDKPVIFKKGIIKRPHFAHCKSDSPCAYYDKPNESQIHKDAKNLMKLILETKINDLRFYRTCLNCKKISVMQLDITKLLNYKVCLEHKFVYKEKKRIADVALIYDDKIHYIFEIYHTHKTRDGDRPEPFFEINAEQLIIDVNKNDMIIECVREHICHKCKIELEKKYEEELKRLQEEELKRKQEEEERKRKQEEEELKKKQEEEEYERKILAKIERQKKELEKRERQKKEFEEEHERRAKEQRKRKAEEEEYERRAKEERERRAKEEHERKVKEECEKREKQEIERKAKETLYLNSLNQNELENLNFARQFFGTNFILERTNGYIKFFEKEKEDKLEMVC